MDRIAGARGSSAPQMKENYSLAKKSMLATDLPSPAADATASTHGRAAGGRGSY